MYHLVSGGFPLNKSQMIWTVCAPCLGLAFLVKPLIVVLLRLLSILIIFSLIVVIPAS